MFSGIHQDRFGQLTTQEERLLDNVKKAFYESDRLYGEGRPEDCVLPMCNAFDAAKTLRRSLRGEDTSPTENARRFKEFIDLEVPAPAAGGLQVALVDAYSCKSKLYSFSDLVYAIRCKVHENENLNTAERPDYHILLEWGQAPRWAPASAGPVSGSAQDLSLPWSIGYRSGVAGTINGGRITLNGHFMWGRLREVMAKFITGIDMMIGFAKGAASGRITSHPPLGSVRPTTHRSR
jgi:hypothetical protein